MKGNKKALKSITIWGGLVALLPVVDQVVSQLAQLNPGDPKLAAILSAIGGLTAIVGRLRAKTEIK